MKSSRERWFEVQLDGTWSSVHSILAASWEGACQKATEDIVVVAEPFCGEELRVLAVTAEGDGHARDSGVWTSDRPEVDLAWFMERVMSAHRRKLERPYRRS